MHLNFLLLTPLPISIPFSHMYILICHPPLPPFHSSMHSPILFPLHYLLLIYALFPSHFSYTLPFFLQLSPLEWTLPTLTIPISLIYFQFLFINLFLQLIFPMYPKILSNTGAIYLSFSYIFFLLSSKFPPIFLSNIISLITSSLFLFFPNSSYFLDFSLLSHPGFEEHSCLNVSPYCI